VRAVALRQAPQWRDPVEALSPFADEPDAVLLLSGADGWSYLLRQPNARLTGAEADPLAALAQLVGPAGAVHPDGPPFQGGVVGLAAYELGGRIEPLALKSTAWPDLHAAFYDALLAFDHPGRRILAVGRGASDTDAEARARVALSWLDETLQPARAGRLASDFEPEPAQAYEAAVADVIGRIAEGELFQANIARAWRGRLASGAKPFDVFARLAGQSPAPFAAYVRLDDRAVASNSPERFLSVADGMARSQPIKGTRPRGATAAEDAALARELAASPKDRAENLMIVDLMRNDLSRVCDPGSIRVPLLCELQSFANVHHLVSTVEGRLVSGAGPADLLRAAFPPGSITGAPKVQAMRVISALEAPRGPYCGALFWAGVDGRFDSSVLIRTVVFEQTAEGWVLEARAGAGIVADSEPRAERLETEDKIAAIARALTEDA
jgi:para-aminobenzoate synthetase component 1